MSDYKQRYKADEVIKQKLELTQSEKIDFRLTDISKAIKQQLNKEFKGCEFSLLSEFYSGGCSLNIYIMKTNFKMILPFEEISDDAFFYYENYSRYSKEDIKREQNNNYHQLNPHQAREPYNNKYWNNGVFLTERGHALIKRIVELTDLFNYDNSDAMTDYFDTHFYLHLNIGKWNKPFIEEIKKADFSDGKQEKDDERATQINENEPSQAVTLPRFTKQHYYNTIDREISFLNYLDTHDEKKILNRIKELEKLRDELSEVMK